MGKGSTQRPTKAEFWSNWDAVFGDKSEDDGVTNHNCERCGWIEENAVVVDEEINYEPFGDQKVERILVNLTCERCGGEVDEFFNV